MSWRSWLSGAVAAASLCTGLSAAAQQVTVERDTPLYGEARLDSKVVATLKPGASGEVVSRNGAWLNIRTTDGAGWLFSFNVRFAPAQQAADASASASGDAAAVGRLVGPRRNINVTSTIGVRGIDEEDLKQAHFDSGQMKLLDQYAVSGEDAENSARNAGLSAARVEYFDAKPQ
ncbi:MAG TPA: hypothetical protein VLT92_11530 [Burkholderiales bacterium]|nr:hypothetical protein [Burkholderiales bacterium]